MIKEWEENTGQKWPIDEKGNRYQLHHIIEQQYGGPNEWWNSHPAKFPDEHQGGIHAKGSPSRELFKQLYIMKFGKFKKYIVEENKKGNKHTFHKVNFIELLEIEKKITN